MFFHQHYSSICRVKRSPRKLIFLSFPFTFFSSLIILKPSEAQIREGGFLAAKNTTVFVQRRHGNRWPLCYVFDPFVVEFYTDCDTCAFKMRNREPVKVVRHISRIACHIGMRSGRAVWGKILQCTKSHCLKPKLCAADPHTLIGADKELDVWWLKAGSSNSGQHLVAMLLGARGSTVFFTYWSKINLLVYRKPYFVEM